MRSTVATTHTADGEVDGQAEERIRLAVQAKLDGERHGWFSGG